MPKQQKNSASFTLVELLVAIAALLCIVAIALPHVDMFDDHLMCMEMDALQGTFLLLQQKAMGSGEEQLLHFEQATHAYRFQFHTPQETRYQLPAGVRFGVLADAQGPPSKPTAAIQHPITFPDNTARFLPNGTITSGTVYMINHKATRLHALTCGISSIALMRMYRYTDERWHAR